MFFTLFQGLAARLPSRCAVCHAWPAQPVCEACIGLFAQPKLRCTRCAVVVADGTAPCMGCRMTQKDDSPLDASLAAVSYGYPWSGLVQEFKFQAQPAWARSMALLMRSAPWVEPALEAADWVIPMPLSAKRLQSRGFNQAWLLAQALSPAKARATWLLRIRDTPAQSSLARKERLSNVANAFAIDPLRQPDLEGKNVLLVDDVMTSGASLRAAALPLRQAGVRQITALVFARAESAG
jgi:ComF family protein